MMAYTCNSGYSGGGDWEDGGSKPTQKKVSETPTSNNKPDMMVYACHASYVSKRPQVGGTLSKAIEKDWCCV
jgi:hypothetical protein